MPAPVEHPFHPIVYVRGYAGTEEAVEETVATPYMGFNLGATKVRQRWTGDVGRLVFESPLVRLIKDHGYLDTYVAGVEAHLGERIPARSVVVYRYYDRASPSFEDDPERPDIPEYARGLDALIDKVRDAVCGKEAPDTRAAREAFRVYLVAHSMGGLICRCFLQDPDVGSAANRAAVDKVFTYATPHNGIDLRIVGNVPGFFSRNNANNFNRKKMAGYLKLPAHEVESLTNPRPSLGSSGWRTTGSHAR